MKSTGTSAKLSQIALNYLLDVSMVLFNGVPVKNFNFAPIFLLAGEYFTHLGLTCMLIHFTVEAY